jgi:hypothetical protein
MLIKKLGNADSGVIMAYHGKLKLGQEVYWQYNLKYSGLMTYSGRVINWNKETVAVETYDMGHKVTFKSRDEIYVKKPKD